MKENRNLTKFFYFLEFFNRGLKSTTVENLIVVALYLFADKKYVCNTKLCQQGDHSNRLGIKFNQYD